VNVKNSLLVASGLLIFLTVSPGASSAKSPLSADQESLLAVVRTEALAYTKKLPDFICTQMTSRESMTQDYAGTGPSGMNRGTNPNTVVSSDEIEEKLTYISQQEHYDVIGINGAKAAGVQHMDFAGAISAGEFGSLLNDIFDPKSQTVFGWGRATSLRGRHAYVFTFQVPREAGARVFDKGSGKQIIAAYAGNIFVDSETKEVLRITTRLSLPYSFPIESAETVVDYKAIEIADKNYNLPFHSEVRVQEAGLLFVNKIDFKAYRKFVTELTIRYGSFADEPVPDERTKASSDLPAPVEKQTSPPLLSPAEQPIAQGPVAEAGTGEIIAKEATPTAAAATTPLAETITASAPQPPPVVKMAPTEPLVANVREATGRMQLRVDLVLVPVVVRDRSGRAVGNLTQDDFQLFDKGKRQAITSFTIESSGEPPAQKEMPGSVPDTAQDKPATRISPTNYVVYLFDDVHLDFDDLARARDAAARQVDTLQPMEQAAILGTSGLVQLAFTSDKAKLHDALLQLRAQPLGGPSEHDCPDVSYYQADQMLNVYALDLANNPPLQAAFADVMACMNGDPSATKFAQTIAINAARRVEDAGKRESRGTLLAIRDVARWLAQKPGRKSIILVSPGFVLATDLLINESDVVDQAIREGVSVSAIDARGVYVVFPSAAGDRRSADPSAFRIKTELARQEAAASDSVLQELADGTGGAFVRDTNDLYGGLQRLAAPPEYTYLLGFKPEGLKLDGSFHPLTVKLNTREKLSPQARRGYYAEKQ